MDAKYRDGQELFHTGVRLPCRVFSEPVLVNDAWVYWVELPDGNVLLAIEEELEEDKCKSGLDAYGETSCTTHAEDAP
jgi:hypothetical protein